MKKQAGRRDKPASTAREAIVTPQDQALYGQLLDGLTGYAVFALSPRGLILSWNAGAEKTFGYASCEIIGKSFELIFTQADRAAGAPQDELDSALNGTTSQHDRWHVRKDATRFWGTNTIERLYDTSHTFIGFTKLVRDTTVSHLAVQKIRDSEQEFRLLFESVKDYGIYSIGLDGTIETWNNGAANLFGFESREILGENFAELFSPGHRSSGAPERALQAATAHGSTIVEGWMKRKNGSEFFGSGKLSQLNPDAAGDKRGFVNVTHDMTEQHAALEHERMWSTTFQRAVLPASLPLITGLRCDAIYKPGSEDAQVGGDWYDAVRLPDGRVLIAIGDVSGHGLESAVIVGVIRQIVRGIAQIHADPALILNAADQALSLEYPEVYVTSWLAVLDQVMRTITYSCAGHPPALLKTAGGTLRELDGDPGLPIGLREGMRGTSTTVPWANGDTLLLYTDGLVESDRNILEGIARLYAATKRLDFTAWESPAEELRGTIIPNGSPDDVAILILHSDFAAFEAQVKRWQLDTADAAAATEVRAKFAASLRTEIFSPADCWGAELVLGELIGNVVRHAEGNSRVDIAIDQSGPHTVVHVLDSGIGFSYISRLAPDLYSEDGRGLFLIAALTTDFHVEKRTGGGSHARAVLRDRSSVAVS